MFSVLTSEKETKLIAHVGVRRERGEIQSHENDLLVRDGVDKFKLLLNIHRCEKNKFFVRQLEPKRREKCILKISFINEAEDS